MTLQGKSAYSLIIDLFCLLIDLCSIILVCRLSIPHKQQQLHITQASHKMSSTATTSPWGEDSIIADLLETLEVDPNNIEARKLLIDQHISLEWYEAVTNLALEILLIRPDDQDALSIVQTYEGQSPGETKTRSKANAATKLRSKKQKGAAVAGPAPKSALITSRGVQQLKEQYEALQKEAVALFREMLVFQKMAPKFDCMKQLADLDALVKGRVYSVAKGQVDEDEFDFTAAVAEQAKPEGSCMATASTSSGGETLQTSKKTKAPIISDAPQSARALAQTMKATPSKALTLALTDFEAVITWQRTTDSTSNNDAIRTTLRRRVDAVKAALPKSLAHIPATAFMHAEHEHLEKRYANAETMITGEAISTIARENFWVSEDNYAWDMEELVPAIKATNGSLRNPLSKQPFSASDIEDIIRHPLGSSIAAVQINQRKLKRGIRPDTIARLKKMATILLNDNSENSFPSHQAVDDFLSYVATLPEAEREAVDQLKVPAVDSHTGQAFDDTIGDAVRDAKGNRICFHKAGDLLKQAAEHLSRM